MTTMNELAIEQARALTEQLSGPSNQIRGARA